MADTLTKRPAKSTASNAEAKIAGLSQNWSRPALRAL